MSESGPPLWWTYSTRLVGLRRSLVRFFDFAHVLIGKPVPTFPGHALILLDALDVDDPAPAGGVALDIVLHLLGRRRRRDVADDREPFADVRQLEDLGDLGIEPVDDRPRGAARGGKPEPGHHLETEKRLGDRRDLGLEGEALARGDREPAQDAAP